MKKTPTLKSVLSATIALIIFSATLSAATYQKADGTLDQIEYRPETGEGIHSYSGENLQAGASLNGAKLPGANLNGADLIGAKLISANLVRTDLSGANLSNADLSNTVQTSSFTR